MTQPSSTTSNQALDAAVMIIKRLHEAGHVAYLAGGCVRDSLLGRTPKDFDVATDAKPDAVLKLFRFARYVGEAFGVVLVRMDGVDVEVATFRMEWGYDDGRRPSNVEFTDAQHDAARRDFTVNGLFADPLSKAQQQLAPETITERNDPSLPATARALGRIIDFVGGRADLAAHRLRAIGNPDERFAEDYLRMLRAVRFTARLGFELEQSTARAIRVHAKYLSQISRERIGLELLPMLSSPEPARRAHAAALIQSLQLDGPTLNEERSDTALPMLTALVAEADYATALVAWMLDRHLVPQLATLLKSDETDDALADHIERFTAHSGEKLVNRWRKALMLSNEHRDALHGTLMLLPRTIRWRGMSVAKKKRLLAETRCSQAVLLLTALAGGGAKPAALLPPILTAIADDAPPLREQGVAPEPIVTGADLIERGLKPSRRFKHLLDRFYDLQLEGELKSKSDFERLWPEVSSKNSGENA